MNKSSVIFVLAAACITASSAKGVSLEWARQFGSPMIDHATGISIDESGNIYIAGSTYGSLEGANTGLSDAFVTKYSSAGMQQWTRQFGTSNYDGAGDVSVDGLGNVYVSGWTDGVLGAASAGGTDLYIRKYDMAGNHQWTRQFGTDATSEFFAGAAGNMLGNVYLVGTTSGNLDGTNAGIGDAFVRKYDSVGDIQWTRQFGTDTYEWGEAVSVDQLGNVYITGATSGVMAGINAGGQDVFVRKYDVAGNVQWTRQFGSNDNDGGSHVTTDDLGNVYISGRTYSSLDGPNAGLTDAFLAKYSSAGDALWVRQFGTSTWDYGTGVTTDGAGDVFVSGYTAGSLGGPSAGETDAFVRKFSPAGEVKWTYQFGSTGSDEPRSPGTNIVTDGMAGIYVSGSTLGALAGPLYGPTDAFIVKLNDAVPEPSCLMLACIALAFRSCQTRYRALHLREA